MSDLSVGSAGLDLSGADLDAIEARGKHLRSAFSQGIVSPNCPVCRDAVDDFPWLLAALRDATERADRAEVKVRRAARVPRWFNSDGEMTVLALDLVAALSGEVDQ